uniref:PORR domain-containing protein n=1 Tax=Soboliphyme baturini TaxID=241478 RepID=A0A183IUL7_9BILA
LFFIQLRVVKAFKLTNDDTDDENSNASGLSSLSLRSLRSLGYRPFSDLYFIDDKRSPVVDYRRELIAFGGSRYLLPNIPEIDSVRSVMRESLFMKKHATDQIGKSVSLDLYPRSVLRDKYGVTNF